jgi:hypothetical protein
MATNEEQQNEQKKFDCSICLTEIETDKKALNCGHLFHGDCVNQWLAQKNNCPLCRKDQRFDSEEEQMEFDRDFRDFVDQTRERVRSREDFLTTMGTIGVLFMTRVFESFCRNHRRRNPESEYQFHIDGLADRLEENQGVWTPWVRQIVESFTREESEV